MSKKLFYKTWKDRTTPNKNALSRAIRFVEISQYGRVNSLTGVDGAIRFWEDRKKIEFEAMRELPLNSFVIDNSDYDWDVAFDNVISILGF